jgi:hypothetical protein
LSHGLEVGAAVVGEDDELTVEEDVGADQMPAP